MTSPGDGFIGHVLHRIYLTQTIAIHIYAEVSISGLDVQGVNLKLVTSDFWQILSPFGDGILRNLVP